MIVIKMKCVALIVFWAIKTVKKTMSHSNNCLPVCCAISSNIKLLTSVFYFASATFRCSRSLSLRLALLAAACRFRSRCTLSFGLAWSLLS